MLTPLLPPKEVFTTLISLGLVAGKSGYYKLCCWHAIVPHNSILFRGNLLIHALPCDFCSLPGHIPKTLNNFNFQGETLPFWLVQGERHTTVIHPSHCLLSSLRSVSLSKWKCSLCISHLSLPHSYFHPSSVPQATSSFSMHPFFNKLKASKTSLLSLLDFHFVPSSLSPLWKIDSIFIIYKPFLTSSLKFKSFSSVYWSFAYLKLKIWTNPYSHKWAT